MKSLWHRDSLGVGPGTAGERLLYRVDEVAGMIGVSKSTAYTLISRNELPSVRLGGMLRVPAAALHKLIEEHTNETRRAQGDRWPDQCATQSSELSRPKRDSHAESWTSARHMAQVLDRAAHITREVDYDELRL